MREYKVWLASETNNQIVVVGGGGVSLFVDEYDPTIEDCYRKQCVIDGDIALLDVLDTAGQEEYSAMREQYMRSGEGFLLVYSITSKTSLEEIRAFHQQILRVKDKDRYPVIIIANKCDLTNERVVSQAAGIQLANQCKCKFVETSAKHKINVDEAFYSLVREIRKYNKDGIRKTSIKTGRKKDKQPKCIIL